MTIFAGNLGLQVHIFVGIAIPHDIARGVAIDALKPLFMVNIGLNPSHISSPADNLRPRIARGGRNQAVVSVVPPLVGQGDPAAAIMTAHTDLVVRQHGHFVTGRMGPLPLDRGIVPLVGGIVVIGEMAGRTTGGVTAAPYPVHIDANMADRAEFPVQFAGQVIQFGNIRQVPRQPGRVMHRFTAGCIECSVLTFPGFLDIFDHAGVGVHQVAPNPLQLVGMTAAAGFLPVSGISRIFRPEHGPMGGFFFSGRGVAAMTGNTFQMRR